MILVQGGCFVPRPEAGRPKGLLSRAGRVASGRRLLNAASRQGNPPTSPVFLFSAVGAAGENGDHGHA
jgi:hypothetical protein